MGLCRGRLWGCVGGIVGLCRGIGGGGGGGLAEVWCGMVWCPTITTTTTTVIHLTTTPTTTPPHRRNSYFNLFSLSITEYNADYYKRLSLSSSSFHNPYFQDTPPPDNTPPPPIVDPLTFSLTIPNASYPLHNGTYECRDALTGVVLARHHVTVTSQLGGFGGFLVVFGGGRGLLGNRKGVRWIWG